jgi:hypothetical protein
MGIRLFGHFVRLSFVDAASNQDISQPLDIHGFGLNPLGKGLVNL